MAQGFVSSSPTITLAGDVTGTTNGNTVAKIQGKTLASSLSSIGSAQDGYALTWVNANSDWEAKAVSSGSSSTGTLVGPITMTPVRSNTSNATYTIDTTGGSGDVTIFHNRSGATTYTLPAPTNGRLIRIKDITGAIETTANNITIAQHASETIEGVAASYVYATNYGALILMSDTTNWWILGR